MIIQSVSRYNDIYLDFARLLDRKQSYNRYVGPQISYAPGCATIHTLAETIAVEILKKIQNLENKTFI